MLTDTTKQDPADEQVQPRAADNDPDSGEIATTGKSFADDKGLWIVLDAGLRLLSIGPSLYHGQAPRSYVDRVARRVLLPMAAEAMQTQAVFDSVRVDGDRRYRFVVRPVLGRSGAVHAVLALYTDADSELPEPPRLGTWEWDAPKLRTYWDRTLFEIYGFDPGDVNRQYWDAPEWFSLLDQGGYPQMREVLARFQTDNTEDLIIHAFRIARADNGQLTTLRLCGRAVLADNGKPRWFRGTTMAVDGFRYEVEEQFREQQYIDAALQLCPAPILVVDLKDTRIYVTNAAWKQSDLVKPADLRLETVIHPDDIDAFSDFLRDAPEAPTQTPAQRKITFAVNDLGWATKTVSAVRLVSGRRSDLYDDVMLMLEDAT